MTPDEFNTLRKEVKKLLIDLDMEKVTWGQLAAMLSEHLGRPINNRSLGMALTGFRQTEAYRTILEGMFAMLSQKKAA